MLKLFLCDDNPLHLQHEEAYIRSLSLGMEYALETFAEPCRVLARIQAGDCPDIAVLDIEMPKVDAESALPPVQNHLPDRLYRLYL